MPFSANSCVTISFLAKWVRPIPRSTMGALVNPDIVVAGDLDAVAPEIAGEPQGGVGLGSS